MPKTITLPPTVFLRTSPVLPAGEAHRALECSRQRAHQWRTRHGFPRTVGGMIDTGALAAWLAARNVRIEWV